MSKCVCCEHSKQNPTLQKCTASSPSDKGCFFGTWLFVTRVFIVGYWHKFTPARHIFLFILIPWWLFVFHGISGTGRLKISKMHRLDERHWLMSDSCHHDIQRKYSYSTFFSKTQVSDVSSLLIVLQKYPYLSSSLLLELRFTVWLFCECLQCTCFHTDEKIFSYFARVSSTGSLDLFS